MYTLMRGNLWEGVEEDGRRGIGEERDLMEFICKLRSFCICINQGYRMLELIDSICSNSLRSSKLILYGLSRLDIILILLKWKSTNFPNRFLTNISILQPQKSSIHLLSLSLSHQSNSLILYL
jgi:hypothetical protein